MASHMDDTKHVTSEVSQIFALQNPSRRPSINIEWVEHSDQVQPLFTHQSENLPHSTFAFEQLKVAEVCCCVLALLGFCCGALGYDLEHRDLESATQRLETDIALVSGTASTALLLTAIYWRTALELKWLQAKCLLSAQDNLFTTRKVHWLLGEIAVNSPHPVLWLRGTQFTYFNHSVDITIIYTYNSWLSVWMLIRIYHVMKVVSILSPFRSARAQRVCSMNGVYPGCWFAVRCLMREKPYHTTVAMVLSGMLVGAYTLRVFERPMAAHSQIDYGQYGNAMWNVLVTMTTVGYGDYYPTTIMGRIAGICVCFWGVLSVSMIIITVNSLLTLDSGEEKALLILNRLSFKQEMRETAARVITSALRYCSLRKQGNSFLAELQRGRFQRFLHEYQRARNQQVALYSLDSFNERMEKRVLVVEGEIGELRKEAEDVRKMMADALGM